MIRQNISHLENVYKIVDSLDAEIAKQAKVVIGNSYTTLINLMNDFEYRYNESKGKSVPSATLAIMATSAQQTKEDILDKLEDSLENIGVPAPKRMKIGNYFGDISMNQGMGI